MENNYRKPIVETLMERDGISRGEATAIRNNFKRDFFEAIDTGDFDYAYDIIMDELGLEPDYIDELIF